MNPLVKQIAIIFLVFLAISAVFTFSSSSDKNPEAISISQLVSQVNEGKVKSVKVIGEELEIELIDGAKETSLKEQSSLTDSLKNYGVEAGPPGLGQALKELAPSFSIAIGLAMREL